MSTFSGGETIVNVVKISFYQSTIGNAGSSANPFYTVPAGRYSEAYIVRKSNLTSFGELRFITGGTDSNNAYVIINESVDIDPDGASDATRLIHMNEGDTITRELSGNFGSKLYIFIKEFTKP
jgi:hypothetical protein